MAVRPVYFHGWPDGSIDTVTMARCLTDLGLEAIEIGVTKDTPGTEAAIVGEYLSQIPENGDDYILIGYCAAARYALSVAEELTRRNRPPLALLIIELIEFSGATFLHSGIERHGEMPVSTQVQHQVQRLLPPFNEKASTVLFDVLRTKLAVGRRIRRMFGARDAADTEPHWITLPYLKPTCQQLIPIAHQPVVAYNAVHPASKKSIYGPAGSPAKYYAGAVAVRQFEGMDHVNVMGGANAMRVARQVVKDFRAIAADEPLHLVEYFAFDDGSSQTTDAQTVP